jgi:hypothetical protein
MVTIDCRCSSADQRDVKVQLPAIPHMASMQEGRENARAMGPAQHQVRPLDAQASPGTQESSPRPLWRMQAGRKKPVGSWEAGRQIGDALEGNPGRAARSQKGA